LRGHLNPPIDRQQNGTGLVLPADEAPSSSRCPTSRVHPERRFRASLPRRATSDFSTAAHSKASSDHTNFHEVNMQTVPVLLRLPTVMKITGLARSTIYKLMDQREFPQQVKLSRRAVAWPQAEIQTWVETRSRVQ
jgi:prophage regulatory protein